MTEAEKMFNMAFRNDEKKCEEIMKVINEKIKRTVKNGQYETDIFFSEAMYKYMPRIVEQLEGRGYAVSGTTSSGCIKISWNMEATKV